MQENSWIYLNNPFESALKSSYKKLIIFTTDHKDKLSAMLNDSFIADLYNQHFINAYQNFKTLYNDSRAVSADYHAQTKILEEQMATLSGKKIKQWDIQIQNFYMDDSREYQFLLGMGRKTFQNGSYEARMQEVTDLLGRVKKYGNLVNIYNDIQAFLVDLEKVRNLQQQLEGQTMIYARKLKLAREELIKSLHFVYTGLCWHFKEDIQMVANFYELKYVRATYKPTDDEVNKVSEELPAYTSKEYFVNEIDENTAVEVENTGTVPIIMFSGSSKNNAIPDNAQRVNPGESDTIFVEDVFDQTNYTTVVAVNISGSTAQFNIVKKTNGS